MLAKRGGAPRGPQYLSWVSNVEESLVENRRLVKAFVMG